MNIRRIMRHFESILITTLLIISMSVSDIFAIVVSADMEVTEDVGTSELIEADNTLEDFIKRLYIYALQRDAEEEGMIFWVNEIKCGNKSVNDVARSFFNSDEYKSLVISDSEYITSVYRVFFDREADSNGYAFWLNELNNGKSRIQIMEDFISSEEWIILCEYYGIHNPTIAIPFGIYEFIERLYIVLLDRVPDEAGLEYWSNELVSGNKSAAGIISQFVRSKEFLNKEFNNEEYLTILYKAFFDREPDAEGLAMWSGILENGMSRQYIIKNFADSQEFINLCDKYDVDKGTVILEEIRDRYPIITSWVNRLFSVYKRNATSSELNNTVDDLVNGSDADSVIFSVFYSDEYSALEVTDEDFIVDLYEGVLGRKPSQAEITSLLGRSRSELLDTVINSDEFAEFCEIAGLLLRKYRTATSSLTYLDEETRARIDSQVHNLKEAFDWSAALKYRRFNADPDCGTQYFAEMGFTTGEGNCYVMAATFLEMARSLGYEGVQIAGMVPSRRGGLTPHSWVELQIDGDTYVFDPNFTNETGQDGYKISYGQSGTWMYVREIEMHR